MPDRGDDFPGSTNQHRCFQHMPVIIKTALLLVLSNVFMTFAWYAHLKNLYNRAWYISAAVSWGIAFFEYMLRVPANRIGFSAYSVGAA